MEAYDEDLTENGWYKTLTTLHEDLYTRATDERWMICIPRSGSWKSFVEDGDLFSLKSFESHVMKQMVVYSNNKNNLAENKFITYNGKEVIIQGSKILCGNGFSNNFNKPSYDKRMEKLALNLETCHSAKILFEETFFNENDESFIVLCISQPLEPHLVLHMTGEGKVGEASPSKREVYGQYLWQHANNKTRLRQSINEKISQFVAIQRDIDTFDEERKSIDKKVEQLAADVLHLLSMCLQIILRDHKLKKLSEQNSQKEAIKSSIEAYVLDGVHKSLIHSLNNIMAFQDASMNRITRNLSSITLAELSIKEQFWPQIPRARRELSLINRHHIPSEKLSCLQNALNFASSKRRQTMEFTDLTPTTPVYDKTIGEDSMALQSCTKTSDDAMSCDDLLPIIIYLIIKCDVPNWFSNLAYLKYFHHAKSLKDQAGFYLATMEAALQHIFDGRVSSCEVASFKRQTSREDVEKLFTLIRDGGVGEVERVLRRADDLRSLEEHDKCHPLCECSKCIALSTRKSRGTVQGRDITIGSRDDKGRTSLHIAAMTGNHEMVDMLVSLGAELNSSDYHGATPLHLAAQAGRQSAIFLLLHAGSNPVAEDNNHNTPLHLACLGGHEGCVKALLYYDPAATVVKVNSANEMGDTPLHIASKWGYVNIAQCLVEYGADAHRTNKRKVTPLNICHNLLMSRVLRLTPTDFSQIVTHVSTRPQPRKQLGNPLMHIKSKKSISSHLSKPSVADQEEENSRQVEKLLRMVADDDVNMVAFICGWNKAVEASKEKCHPLCQCFKCQPNSIEACLHANCSDESGRTPLIITSKMGFYDMTQLLLHHGAKVNVATKQQGHSPLHLASQYGHEKIVETLLAHNATCDVRDFDGNTAIFMASMNGHRRCVEILIEAGASVNIRNHRGDSPLHESVRWNHSATACLLLERGALPYYKNKRGQTAMDWAKNDHELFEMMMETLQRNLVSADGNPDAEERSPARPTSLNLADADELIAEGLYKQFQNTPSTPPLINSEPSLPHQFNLSPADDVTFDIISSDQINSETAAGCDVAHSHVTQQLEGGCDVKEKLNEAEPTIDDIVSSPTSYGGVVTSSLHHSDSDISTTVNAGKHCNIKAAGSNQCETCETTSDEIYFEIATKLTSNLLDSIQSASTLSAAEQCDITEPVLVEDGHNEAVVSTRKENLLKHESSDYFSLDPNKKK
ncbi:ankyrin repeat domain-containing protein 27-like [Clavelina lepadiformis]|uniref:ankyrin repeat domain-containing protein 27-like n=1 Tax=Clavelina lepadiformis TaxID=159417 RepID=UPI004042BCCF